MKTKFDLTKGNIIKDLLIVALPTLATSLIQMAYNLTDMYWVSKTDQIGLIPEQAVAAIGTVGFYPWFGFGLIMIAKIGTSVKVAQAAGQNDMTQVERIGNNGLSLMLLFGLLYSLFGIALNGMYVGWFDIETAAVNTMAMNYMRIIGFFGIAFFTVNLFNGVYDGLGKTINTLYVTMSGLILNIILDPFFILETVNVFGLFTINGLGMGVEGAAWATGIGQSSILIIYLILYSSRFKPFVVRLKSYFDWHVIKGIVKIGLPVGIQSMFFTTISMIIARMVVSYGDQPLAIQRIGSQIESVAWMIASGFQVALASFVGQNFGALKYDRIKLGYKKSMTLLVPYGLTINLLMFVFAGDIFKLFFSDPTTLAIGKTYLEILSVSQLFMIVELATAGVFNGLGKTAYPSGVGIVGNILRIPGAILLSASLGYAGIWWAVSGSSIIKGTVLVVWVIYFLRKLGQPGGLLFENSD
ncbi:MATE family efflux transporter [Candidatus Xianfuyuplasma coldseepsis]|uniref:Probable multidrug resistance protein NorM n=1 Tax=Candidatus Xianfuyuplasma coldseepsis TaxID=2782163 RepID=A0A7L7KSK9_9MOLU|nr:MATE family efflux transporter [Xianfuyuplasma coldseepsis]QMS85399.1 MATE family efflux transporter [Xianfuyuplasma coldseepsis]